MRVALIAPPFIPVPPGEYGGTGLFIAHLALGLQALGVDVTVYTNGESTVNVDKRWLFTKSHWPLKGDDYAQVKDVEHTAWALRAAVASCDIIHLNTAAGLACTSPSPLPCGYTLHHSTDAQLSDVYSRFPDVDYVCISKDQAKRESDLLP